MVICPTGTKSFPAQQSKLHRSLSTLSWTITIQKNFSPKKLVTAHGHTGGENDCVRGRHHKTRCSHLFKNDSLGHGRSTQRVRLHGGDRVRLVVVLVTMRKTGQQIKTVSVHVVSANESRKEHEDG